MGRGRSPSPRRRGHAAVRAGHVIRRHVTYEPETPPAKADAEAIDLSIMAPDVDGPLTQRHPDACQALFDAAGDAGAVTLRGVEDVVVGEVDAPGARDVSYEVDGSRYTATARLVVAADGRNSVVVRQLGWTRHKDEPHHLFSGLFVDDAHGFPADIQVIGCGSCRICSAPLTPGRPTSWRRTRRSGRSACAACASQPGRRRC